MGAMTPFPWANLPAADDTAHTVKLLQRDFSIAVQCTAVLVHSSHPNLQILVNTKRGQIIPRGECKLSDGTVLEFQDIGMPQPNTPMMTVKELLAMVWDVLQKMGLELVL